jgi:hypothetical protein
LNKDIDYEGKQHAFVAVATFVVVDTDQILLDVGKQTLIYGIKVVLSRWFLSRVNSLCCVLLLVHFTRATVYCLLVQRHICFSIETDTTYPFKSFPSNTSLFIELIVECCNMFLLLMFAAKPSSICVLIQFAKSVVSSVFYLANRMHSRDDDAP